MNQSLDILQGELERLFTLNELMNDLCRELLGIDPEELGGAGIGKAAFVRKLIDRCQREQATIALADALFLSKSSMIDPRIKQIYSAPVDDDLAPGSVVGPYEVVEAAGTFSLGHVYRARVAPPGSRPRTPGQVPPPLDFEALEKGERPEQPAAEQPPTIRIEVVTGAFTPDRRAVQRYLTTLRALKHVQHKSIPRPLAVGTLPDGRPWAAYEETAGAAPFSTKIAEAPMPVLDSWPILRGVLDGLDALHRGGLAHGDVKVENVLVRQGEPTDPVVPPPWEVLLIGIGSDRLFSRPTRDDRETGPLTGAGTPKCMSPEQARGRTADRRSDLYGFGAMLFEVCTGKTVFSGRSGIDLVARHLTEPPKPPSTLAPKGTVPEELDKLVADLLNKDPLRRPKDVPAVISAFEGVIKAARDAATEPEGTIEDARTAADLFIESPTDDNAALLEDAARAARAWDVARETYEMSLETTEDEEVRTAIRLRLARVLHGELGDVDAASEIYTKILEARPNDPATVAALEALKRRERKFDDVIALLFQRVERAEDPADKVKLLREVARIYEAELGQPDRALTVMLVALQLDQSDALLDDLTRLAGHTGQWTDLVQECSTLVQNIQDPALVVSISTLMGQCYGERLGRQDYALPCFQQALAIDPSNDKALKGMEEIFRQQQQWSELAQVVISRAEAARYPADRRDRLAEAASIFDEHLGDHARAIEIHRRVLADDPAHAASGDALERIFTRTKAWTDLIQLYHAKDEALSDEARKAETRYLIGGVYEDHIGNKDKAIQAYKAVLAIDDRHVPALKGLERLFAITGAYQELLDTLKVQLDFAATPRQRVALRQRRAQILEEEFVKREEALSEYSELLAIEANNEEALIATARLLRQLERWSDLDATLADHISVASDKSVKVELLRARAELLTAKLDDSTAAVEVLTTLAELDPDNADVLLALAKQRLAVDDVKGAIAALELLTAVTPDGSSKAQIWVRIGELQEKSVGDQEAAEAAYRKALDADKANVAAAAALHDRYAEKGDMTAALDMLERQLSAAPGDLERSRICTQMGHVCRNSLGEPERAVEFYEKALELDRSNAEAAEPLAEIHREAGRWDAAAAIYARFADAAAAMPPEKKLEFFTVWGKASVQLGELDKAIRAFESALAVVPGNTEVLRDLAETHFAAEHWDAADTCFTKVLETAAEGLETSRRVELYVKQGLARKNRGDLDAAAESLDAALELGPADRTVLRYRADVSLQARKFDRAAEVLERLAAASDDDGKAEVLAELGAVYGDELAAPDKAAKTLSAALAIKPNQRNLLMRLMKAYNTTEQWSNLVEVILQIADLESDTLKMAKYYHSAAVIAHQKLGRTDEAREYYEMAIEQDPTLSKSFESLAALLTEKEDWPALAKGYQKMIERLPPDTTDEAKVTMFDALAGILHNQLAKPDEAIEFYERAHKLDPENRQRKETLARLYDTSMANAAKAIQLHHQLLGLNPFRQESYQTLRRIYAATGQWDQQFCVARTLVALHMADEEEEELYRRFKTDEIPPPGDCLTPEQWQNHLMHRSQSPLITNIFETIMPAVLKEQARPHKAFGVDPANARNLDADDHPFSGLVRFAAGTLGIEPPAVFFKEDQQTTAFAIQTNPPAILAGSLALKAAYENPRALAFVVGRHLAYSRGGHFLRVLLESGTMMRAWLMAALKHVVPKIPVSADMAGTVTSCGSKLTQYLGPGENEALRTQVLSFIDSAAKVDLKQWGMAVDYTADRVGFLLCDDLEIASQLIRLEQGSATPVKDRLKELNLFSVSQDYFAIRQKLLIQLRVEA